MKTLSTFIGCVVGLLGAWNLNAAEIDSLKPFSFKLGVSLEYDNFFSRTEDYKQDYFSSSYHNGLGMNVLMKNNLYYKNWFISFDLALSWIHQKQELTLTNDKIPLIKNTFSHSFTHWFLNYGLGKRFVMKDKDLELTIGFSTVGYFGDNLPRVDKFGSFSSSYIEYGFIQEEKTEEYSSQISYWGNNFISPYFKFGIGFPVKNDRFGFGVSCRLDRMRYETIIYVKGTNYTAIAHSKSFSNATGLFLYYQF